jgi:3-oxoacyl-[acyl-carrier protein] reductase
MDLGIAGRRALVCGASQGLGHACALALAQEGAAVTLVSRRRPALEEAASAIEKEVGRRPDIIACGLATIEGLGTVLTAAAALDILVTNAGGPPAKDFRELSTADWDLALRTNFLSSVELIKSFVDGMIARFRPDRQHHLADRSHAGRTARPVHFDAACADRICRGRVTPDRAT